MANDPYIDPDTGVLRNLLGISDQDELDRVEAEITALRLAQLAENPLPGAYDLQHLRAVHKQIFGDLYAWAGELRTVAIAKRDVFCLPQHIRAFADEVFARLARDNYLQGLDHGAFASGLAEFLGDINALHPFREGNGRAQRALVSQLTRSAGYELRWTEMKPEENVRASQAAHRGDNGPLRQMLARLIVPGRSSDVMSGQPSHPENTAAATYERHHSPSPGEGSTPPRIPQQSSRPRHTSRRKPPGTSGPAR